MRQSLITPELSGYIMSMAKEIDKIAHKEQSIVDFCQRQNIQLTALYRFIKVSTVLEHESARIKLPKYYPCSWQEAVYAEIFDIVPGSDEMTFTLPVHYEESMEKAMSSLTEIETAAIMGVYRDNLSYQRISEDLGVTREAIRQAKKRALHKLSLPESKFILLHNPDVVEEAKVQYEDERAKEIEQIKKELRNRDYALNMMVSNLQNAAEKDNAENPSHEMNAKSDELVSNIQMSVRLKNVLQKHDIVVLSDLLPIEGKEIMKFKDFGRTSCNELIKLLSLYGFCDKANELSKLVK